MEGLIHIYCGDGKGKTTAALGLVLRAAGSGMKVLIGRFLKNDLSSEVNLLNSIDGITLIPCKKQFGFYSKMSPEQKKEAAIYYDSLLKNIISTVINENYDLLILDEVIPAFQYELINQEELIHFLKYKPSQLEVVLTGRDPSADLLSIADYVSNIQKIKHPFDKGIPARTGIEK